MPVAKTVKTPSWRGREIGYQQRDTEPQRRDGASRIGCRLDLGGYADGPNGWGRAWRDGTGVHEEGHRRGDSGRLLGSCKGRDHFPMTPDS